MTVSPWGAISQLSWAERPILTEATHEMERNISGLLLTTQLRN